MNKLKLNNLFLWWLETNRDEFEFSPEITSYEDYNIVFRLHGVNQVFVFQLAESGITISIIWDGELVDILRDFEVAEKYTEQGWTCMLEEPEYAQYWPTQEDLWIEHCFNRFMEWVNNSLAKSTYIRISFIEAITMATLLNNIPDGEIVRLPNIRVITTTGEEGVDSIILPIRT